MEIEITEDKENRLLKRREIRFKITNENEPTPKRADIITRLVQDIGVSKDRIVIDHMKPEFGIPSTKGYAKVYKSKEDALYYESKPILKRNKLAAEESKKKKKIEGK